MTIMTLYKGAGASVTTVYTEGRVESGYFRLIADEGRAITDGTRIVTVVDTDTPYDWTDCDADTDDELTAEEALDILTGGESDEAE